MSTPAQERAWDRKAIAADGESLADLRPDLAGRALRNLSRPSVIPARLRLRSNAQVLWACQCGTQFPGSVCNAVKTQVFVCRTCQRRGKSRFEFQVAELLRVLTGLEVQMHHGERLATAVDLYLPRGDVAIQLDPVSSHVKKFEVDRKRLDALRGDYRLAIRVREEPLHPLPGCVSVPPRADAYVWAIRITEHLNLSVQAVSEEGITQALERASAQWESVLTSPPSPSLADHADLAAEFVANVTHPGRGPAWLAAGAGDIATWRCKTCQNVGNAQVAHRTGPRPTGCEPCATQRRRLASVIAPVGQRILDLAPGLIQEFVANLDLPDAAIASAFTSSSHRCLWSCTFCGNEWEATISNRARHSHTGCQPCNLRRAWADGVRDSAANDTKWGAALAVLASFTEREGHACPFVEHREGDFHLGNWVRTQRKQRAAMNQERAERLEGLPGWVWNTRDEAWERGYTTLAVYVAREGHANVPYRHLEQGQRLGAWVVTQRQSRERLSPACVLRLEALPGWKWVGTRDQGRSASSATESARPAA